MPNLPRFPISFPDGRVALGVRGRPGSDLGPALRGMGLTTGVPTLVVVFMAVLPSDTPLTTAAALGLTCYTCTVPRPLCGDAAPWSVGRPARCRTGRA